MKKFVRFITLGVATLTAGAIVGCNHTHTFDTSAWESDATMHWNKATCEHATEKGNVGGHVDANKDGVCEVCGYGADHVHTYAEAWTYDETNHWKDSTCFHDVKNETATHTPDAFGVCTVCGYEAPQDVSTVAGAIAVASIRGGLINSGSIETFDGKTDFQKGEGYVRLTAANWVEGWYESAWEVSDEYYVAYGEGETDAWHIYNDAGTMTVDTMETEVEAVNGYAYEKYALVGGTGYYYGTEDVVSSLYALKADAVEGTFVEGTLAEVVGEEDMEGYEDYMAFKYNYIPQDSNGIYRVMVGFTLSEDNTFGEVAIMSEHWYENDNGAIPTEGEGEEVYEVPADGGVMYEIEQTVGKGLACPYNKDELLATAWTLVDMEEQEVGETITVEQGSQFSLMLTETAPSSAQFAFDEIKVSAIDSQDQEVVFDWWGNYIASVSNDGYINMTIAVVGEYTVTVETFNVSKTFTLVVEQPATTQIYTTVDDAQTSSTNVYLGSDANFGVETNAYADASCEIAVVAPTGSLVATSLTVNPDTGMATFTPDVVGTYTITVTSTATNKASDIQPWTLTVEVATPPTPAEILNGAYIYDMGWGMSVTAVFTPDSDGATTGSISIADTLGSQGSSTFEHTTTYSYDDTTGAVVLAEPATYTISNPYRGDMVYAMTFKVENYALVCVYDQNGWPAEYVMEPTVIEEGGSAEEYLMDKTFAGDVDGTTWYFSFTYYPDEEMYQAILMDSTYGTSATFAVMYDWAIDSEPNYMGEYAITLTDLGNGFGNAPVIEYIAYNADEGILYVGCNYSMYEFAPAMM